MQRIIPLLLVLLIVPLVSAETFLPNGPFHSEVEAEFEIVVFSDLQSEYTQRWYEMTYPDLLDTHPEARFLWVFMNQSIHAHAADAARAALCADSNNRFRPYLETLLNEQDEWANADDPSVWFIDLAVDAGIERSVFVECLESEATRARLEKHLELVDAQDVRGSPTFFIGPRGEYTRIAGAQPLDVYERAIAALDDERSGDERDDQDDGRTYYRFVPQGPIEPLGASHETEIVVFTSPGDPFTTRWYENVYPELRDEYPDMRTVWTFYPLSVHEHSEPASRALLCSMFQRGFSEYLKSMVENDDWSEIDDPTRFFTRLADSQGLDTDGFTRCLDDVETQNRLDSHVALGERLNIRGTPTFFIGPADGPYARVLGAQAYEVFSELLDEATFGPEQFETESAESVPDVDEADDLDEAEIQDAAPVDRSCVERDVRTYTCANGERVEWCSCIGGEYRCIDDPQVQCPTEPVAQDTCDGCLVEGRCVDLGVRFDGTYCGFDGVENQLDNDVSCSNDYECRSNECSSGACTDLAGQIEENRNLLERIIGFLSGLFG